MDHVAILRKKGKLLAKIIAGKKTIESRWYAFKRAPYHGIVPGETIYFKESGEPIMVKATACRVLFFDALHAEKTRRILAEYGTRIGVKSRDIPSFAALHAGKRYCTLVFLRDVQRIKPFTIDKSGFGMMTAWITVPDIRKIQRPHKKIFKGCVASSSNSS